MTDFPPQRRIPATYMRGGTSKGVFFRLQDLPPEAQAPGPARDALLLRVVLPRVVLRLAALRVQLAERLLALPGEARAVVVAIAPAAS